MSTKSSILDVRKENTHLDLARLLVSNDVDSAIRCILNSDLAKTTNYWLTLFSIYEYAENLELAIESVKKAYVLGSKRSSVYLIKLFEQFPNLEKKEDSSFLKQLDQSVKYLYSKRDPELIYALSILAQIRQDSNSLLSNLLSLQASINDGAETIPEASTLMIDSLYQLIEKNLGMDLSVFLSSADSEEMEAKTWSAIEKTEREILEAGISESGESTKIGFLIYVVSTLFYMQKEFESNQYRSVHEIPRMQFLADLANTIFSIPKPIQTFDSQQVRSLTMKSLEQGNLFLLLGASDNAEAFNIDPRYLDKYRLELKEWGLNQYLAKLGF